MIVDGTLGGGGHAEALLQRGARVIGLDRDPAAIARAQGRLASFGERFTALEANFAEVEERLGGAQVDGLVLDLGVSSPQLDSPERGFSFQKEGPLDMRMGREGLTARELIENTPERELAQLIRSLGEERFARPIARQLKRALPSTTTQAAEVIQRAVPRRSWPKHLHPATRTFQALRIAVNRELEALSRALEAIPRLLLPGGVAAVISFHSLEDRRVKEAFRELCGRCRCPPGLPLCRCGAKGDFRPLTKKPITASEEEVLRNPRARSAKLRAVEKLR